jgi:WD40 repeat protein
VCSLAWLPGNTRLVSGGYDRAVRVWDVEAEKMTLAIPAGTARVWSVALAPDGKSVAAACGDGSVKVWEIATGKAVTEYNRHPEGASGVAWRGEGDLLVSSGHDVAVRFSGVAAAGSEK